MGEQSRMCHPPGAFLKQAAWPIHVTIPPPFKKQWTCPDAFTLQLPSQSQQVCTSHKGDTLWLCGPGGQGAGIPELHGNETIRKTVLNKPLLPGHCTDKQTKTQLQYSFDKGILIWSFSMRDRLQVSHMSTGEEGPPGEYGQGDKHHLYTTLWPHCSSTRPPRKELIHSSTF